MSFRFIGIISASKRVALASTLLACTIGLIPVAFGGSSVTPTTAAQPKDRAAQPTYSVIAGLDGEIFPVFANYASMRQPNQREWGVVSVRIVNSSDKPLHNRVSVQIPGWSDQEIQTVELAAGESRTFAFAPTFSDRLFRNREILAATAAVSVTDSAGKVVYQTTAPVRLRSSNDIYWGPNFEFADYIASWVTPHDPEVERILSRAKESMPGRRLPGYEEGKSAAQQEKMTRLQAAAIYRALQQKGVSYVKSSLTFGRNLDVSERIRTPGETLLQSSANCVDGVVMYASLFENLGMDPVVVLIPGHAYVGVRVAKNSSKYLFIETALTGRASFDVAVGSAQRGLAKLSAKDINKISVAAARTRGIFPMPTSASLGQAASAPRISGGS